ncbi:MAG: YeeE/YedE family protein [Marinospirillum sp.]|uniref:YeeE/YedE family protein n=1 Tax=Marinospirillum sp. TaxID=2183934 RepID=UPI0019F084BE|nr:YeeE/YedE thiosulfate transporter family protein [Marinospirillum sp.]MBE0507922.1 YeeE/YedE family protein [Marinospirillum sp.]
MTSENLILALTGGLLIGIAACLLLLLTGRIAGISGLINRLMFSTDRLWPALFLIGLVLGAAMFYWLGGERSSARNDFPVWLLALAGVLVGFGTSLAKGCTSGHGVCGLGRMSIRSLAAVLTFLLTGIITTFVVRHLMGVMG